MGYGKKLRKFTRNASAYALGYIHAGHRGGYVAYKAASAFDNSLPKSSTMTPVPRKHKSRTPRTPRAVRYTKKFKKHPSAWKSSRKTLFQGKRFAPFSNVYAAKTQDISQHNDLSSKSKRIVLRKGKRSNKLIGRYLYSENYDTTVDGENEGKQSVCLGKYLMTTVQLVGGQSSNLIASTTTWGVDPYQMNPYVNSAAGAYWSTTPALAYDDQFHIDSCNAKFSIVSFSAIPQRVKIYWLMYKKNCGSTRTPDQIWTDCIDAEALGSTAYVPPTVETATTATAGKPDAYTVGQDPFRHKTFRSYFKKLHAEEFSLQPGDQRHFNIHLDINKTINQLAVRELQVSNNYFMGGVTIVPMIIAWGGLVHIKDTTTVGVTYGRHSYGVVSNNIYSFKGVKMDRVSTIRHFNGMVIGNSGTHEVLASQTVREGMIDDTDDPQANMYLS